MSAARPYILGMDPGPEKSAVVLWTGATVLQVFYRSNGALLAELKRVRASFQHPPFLAIERIAGSFGKVRLGTETFETCYWAGRFIEGYGEDMAGRITRAKAAGHLIKGIGEKKGDPEIKAVLKQRYPAAASVLTGQSGSHGWAALAVAVCYYDQWAFLEAERLTLRCSA